MKKISSLFLMVLLGEPTFALAKMVANAKSTENAKSIPDQTLTKDEIAIVKQMDLEQLQGVIAQKVLTQDQLVQLSQSGLSSDQLAAISQGLPADVLAQLADTTSSDQTMDNAPLTRKEKMVVGALGAGAGIGISLKAYQAQLKNEVMESILKHGGDLTNGGDLINVDDKIKIKDPKSKVNRAKKWVSDRLMDTKQQEKIQAQMKERAKKAVADQSTVLDDQIQLLKKSGIIGQDGNIMDNFDELFKNKKLTLAQESTLDALKKLNPRLEISEKILKNDLLDPMKKLTEQVYDPVFLKKIDEAAKKSLQASGEVLQGLETSPSWYKKAQGFFKRNVNRVKSWFGKGGAKEAFETFLKKDLAKAL